MSGSLASGLQWATALVVTAILLLAGVRTFRPAETGAGESTDEQTE
jgi:hypothetical protein